MVPEQKEVKGELSKPPTSTGNDFIPPQISNTFEVSADILTLAEVGSGWLMADGREEKRTRQAAVSSQPIDSQINGLVTIRAEAPLKQDLAVYRKDFQRSCSLSCRSYRLVN